MQIHLSMLTCASLILVAINFATMMSRKSVHVRGGGELPIWMGQRCSSNGKYRMSMSQVVEKMLPGSQCTLPSCDTSARILLKSGANSCALQTQTDAHTRQ